MKLKKSNIFKLIFIIIFNFNTIGLPFGVMWSNVLSPGMFIWMYFKKKLFYVVFPFVLLCLYITIQFISFRPIDISSFLFGATYFYTSMVAGVFTYVYLQQKTINSQKIENIFLTVIKLNLILVLIASLLYFTPFKEFMWKVSENFNSYGELRLKLFFYEPAHFGFVFVFFTLYLFYKLIFYPSKQYLVLFLSTFIAVFIGHSIGTMGAMVIAGTLASFFFIIPLLKKIYKQIIIALVFLLLAFLFFGESTINRMDKVLEGKDNSGNVRVVYATLAAYNMVDKYNYYFGVGFSQTKEYAVEFTSMFPGYSTERLPNSFASTLATVGVVGITLKFLFLLYFFFKTRVSQNIFRLTTFFYVLIYGFTGGWMFNVYEFILWAFAFSPVFSEFDRKNIFVRKRS